MHVAYPRKEIEAFLAKVAFGKISLDPPDNARQVLIKRTRDLLGKAKAPITTDDMLPTLRKQIRLGPSDQDQFFFATMWRRRTLCSSSVPDGGCAAGHTSAAPGRWMPRPP